VVKMIKLVDILLEEYPKGKYIPLEGDELNQAKEAIYDLIQNAYSNIGGHLKITSPNDILDPATNFWRAADIDADPELDVVYFGKLTPVGVKHTGMGHDGERANIKNLLIRKSKELGEPGNYVEVSGGAFNSFVKRGGVPIIDDEVKVRAVLSGKEIEWHGEHPDGKHEGSGWYTRMIAGQPVTKTLVGNI
tara:strand:- start:368 stop:940 length:573 start_codon:yes stop_codon:yes gene_type:complete